MGSYLHSIEYYLPEEILDNNKLSNEFSEWDPEKILEKIGIQNRHILSKSEMVWLWLRV
jgi:3-oxoacyl-[acyl-carrier-protein] synthase-3